MSEHWPPLDVPGLEHKFVETNGIRLHTVQAGPADGPLVILLHGFPEFWYGWKHQIGPLAAAGLRVVAPDQRGYNESDKPKELDSYRLDHMVQDVIGLLDANGHQKAHIVGHDWGGVVSWRLAMLHPERVERLGILNVPHLSIFPRRLPLMPQQWLKSSYVVFFQIPGLPEAMLRNNNWQLMVQAMRRSSRPNAFSKSDFNYYRRAWWRQGAITSMLNWYRAMVRRPPHMPQDERIHVPTLMLWGVHDVALGREMAQPSIEMCDDGRLVFFEGATHWVQHEEVAAVNRELIGFLGG